MRSARDSGRARTGGVDAGMLEPRSLVQRGWVEGGNRAVRDLRVLSADVMLARADEFLMELLTGAQPGEDDLDVAT